jgi:hypothetical protein
VARIVLPRLRPRRLARPTPARPANWIATVPHARPAISVRRAAAPCSPAPACRDPQLEAMVAECVRAVAVAGGAKTAEGAGFIREQTRPSLNSRFVSPRLSCCRSRWILWNRGTSVNVQPYANHRQSLPTPIPVVLRIGGAENFRILVDAGPGDHRSNLSSNHLKKSKRISVSGNLAKILSAARQRNPTLTNGR